LPPSWPHNHPGHAVFINPRFDGDEDLFGAAVDFVGGSTGGKGIRYRLSASQSGKNLIFEYFFENVDRYGFHC
jgi:hypothetical protein